MTRFARLLVALLLPALLIVGCGGVHHAAPPANSANATSVPPGPAESSGDAQPINGNCPTSNTKAFAKTKFVAHTGLAFGAFHRYLYKPYQAGTFKKGAPGRIKAFVKGGLAALFIKREIRLAIEDVKANPTLCKAIAQPLATIGNDVQGAFDKVKRGDSSGLDHLNSQVSSVEGASAKNGDPITENDNPDLTSAPK